MIKLFLLIVIMSLLSFKLYIFFQIDHCLDKGGAWDYPKKICIFDDNLTIEEMKCISKKKHYNKRTKTCINQLGSLSSAGKILSSWYDFEPHKNSPIRNILTDIGQWVTWRLE